MRQGEILIIRFWEWIIQGNGCCIGCAICRIVISFLFLATIKAQGLVASHVFHLIGRRSARKEAIFEVVHQCLYATKRTDIAVAGVLQTKTPDRFAGCSVSKPLGHLDRLK
jgi:hypothetical protein